MRCLIFSDLHFFSAPSELPQYKNRLDYQRATCSWLAGEIAAREPDLVVNLGDSAHRHASITMDALQAFGQSMNEIAEACKVAGDVPFIIVAGNHDQATVDGSVTFLNGLMAKDAWIVAHEWRRFTTPAGGTMAVLPHTTDTKKLDGWLAEHASADLTLIHQDVKDVLWSPGRPSPTGVDLSCLARRGWTIGGHYHHPQLFEEKRLAIVGSPFYASWSDSIVARPRGYLWFDSEEGPSWVENQLTPIRHTLRVGKSEEAVEWVEEFPVASRGRLMLRVLTKTEKGARNVERKLAEMGLLKVLARCEDLPEIAISAPTAMDLPEKAVEDFARQAIAASAELAKLVSFQELVDLGLEGLRGTAAQPV